MAKDPLAEHAEKLLRAFDFSAEATAREEEHRNEMRRLLLSLLDVVDSFDRHLAGSGPSTDGGWTGASSAQLIARQLECVLEQAGVTPVPCLGQDFDPERHEAMETQPGDEPDGVIVKVLSRGFDWNGRPLRRPRVAIARSRKESEA